MTVNMEIFKTRANTSLVISGSNADEGLPETHSTVKM